MISRAYRSPLRGVALAVASAVLSAADCSEYRKAATIVNAAFLLYSRRTLL